MEETMDVKYAGFWRRMLSYILDVIVLFIPIGLIQYIFSGSTLDNPNMVADQVVNIGIWGIYYVVCETSFWQATVGQKVVGLKVTNMGGNKVTVGQATTRYLMMFPACILFFVGIIMIAFTDKKQGMHDKAANALVVCA